ncbi:hypothetical protein N836_32265 [Leptolyngbya sp. Heron Island J]|nr:hypothetical protein N836_32265 [Leptolyngbya sp. Heron Island J]
MTFYVTTKTKSLISLGHVSELLQQQIQGLWLVFVISLAMVILCPIMYWVSDIQIERLAKPAEEELTNITNHIFL